MARLGVLFLSAILSSLPRIFQHAVVNIRTRLFYAELAPSDPALLDFTAELSAAIDRHRFALAEGYPRQTLVVEVHRLTRLGSKDGTMSGEVVSVTLRDDHCLRPLILHYSPAQRASAARTLIRHLSNRLYTPN
jgi:hypothetical protein